MSRPLPFVAPSRTGRLAIAGLLLLMAPSGHGDGQVAPSSDRPNLSGTWKLVPGLIDEVRGRVELATASSPPPGAPGFFGVLVPKSGVKKDLELAELRKLVLDSLALTEGLEIEQGPSEVTIIHGAEDVRIFYLDREHVRNDYEGRKLRCKTRWDGPQLVIEQEGEKKVRIIEMLSLVPSRNQLSHAFRIESGLLREPLELSLVYGKVAS
jgi:hypothetical protein